MLIAKFKCTHVTRYEHGGEEIHLAAVTSGEGNESWCKFTPSGNLSMHITNPDAIGKVKPGVEYMIRVDPVPQP